MMLSIVRLSEDVYGHLGNVMESLTAQVVKTKAVAPPTKIVQSL